MRDGAACAAYTPDVPERIVSITEASRLTGLPKAAILSRVERGELRAIRRGGLRRISVDELAECGLLEGAAPDEAGDQRELLDRLERQAEEIGRLRFELAIAQRRADTERRRRERVERRMRRR
jgi:excisionase family DNA binding protein